jgi:pectin methylesterase-like acyl-CoA thioesterase
VLVGDSTMATRTGYGDAFCGLFKWQVACANLARGGRSTRSYRADGSWDRALEVLRDGGGRATYVLIQFGHNDQPGKAQRSTDLATEYPANLRRYVGDARREGARPVLVTPLTRRVFGPDGTLRDRLAPWAEAVRRVAAEEGVPLLDLHADSVKAVERLGPAGAEGLAMAAKGEKDFDHTHVGPRGAALFARLLARRVGEALPEVAAEFAVGAIEPDGRVTRPQLTVSQADAHSYARVLGPWNPLASPLATGAALPADLVVDAKATEDARTFRSVQSAINAALARAAPDRVHILVRPGTYEGLVYIPASAPPITLHGNGVDAHAVRIRATLDATWTGARYAGAFGAVFAQAHPDIAAMFAAVKERAAIGTPGSAVAWVRARGFQARNLTIENGHNRAAGDLANHSQAVALLLDDADEAHLEGVRLTGYQDTFYLAATSPDRPARAFVHRASIEGDMDFIFGEATAYFLESEVRSLGDRAISSALAPSTHLRSPYGFVFERCRFTHDGSPNARAGVFKLARQWFRSQAAVGKVAILNSSIGTHIDPVRPWADWGIGTPRHRPVQYEFLAEFANTTE